MKITLEMVDEVIQRTHVSYKVAKDALENNEGDVLKAIIAIETMQFETPKVHKPTDIVEKLKMLVNEGMVRQILIEKNQKVVVDIPVFAGAIGAVLFTKSTIVAIVAAVATGCEIKLVKKDGTIVNFNDLTQEKFEDLKSFFKPSSESVEEVIEEADEDVQ